MARKGCTRVIYKGTFISKQTLHYYHHISKKLETYFALLIFLDFRTVCNIRLDPIPK